MLGYSEITGFIDGSLRIFYIKKDEFVLRQSLRPHKDQVSSIVFKRNARVFATSSRDKSIFIFTLNSSCEIIPIGFFKCEDDVAYFDWKDDNRNYVIQYKTFQSNYFEISVHGDLTILDRDENRETYELQIEQTPNLDQQKLGLIAQSVFDEKESISIHGTDSKIVGSSYSFDSLFNITCGSDSLIVIQRIDSRKDVLEIKSSMSSENNEGFEIIECNSENDIEQPEELSSISAVKNDKYQKS